MEGNDSTGVVLHRFFSGLSEYIFHSKLGVADTEMVDYVSDLLVRFTKADAANRIRQLNGRPATEVVTMMAEAQQRVGLAKRAVHRHIGDFTLFWSGMYPEALREPSAAGKDTFVSYCHFGKRAYGIASQIESDPVDPPCALLKRLSDQFEMCTYALREIRREWEENDRKEGEPPILLL